MKRVLWYLIAGSRGGENRARIIKTLYERPFNVNQLSEELNLDYKTVEHHIKVLKDHNVIVTSSGKKKYGALYFLSSHMEEEYPLFLEIANKIKKK